MQKRGNGMEKVWRFLILAVLAGAAVLAGLFFLRLVFKLLVIGAIVLGILALVRRGAGRQTTDMAPYARLRARLTTRFAACRFRSAPPGRPAQSKAVFPHGLARCFSRIKPVYMYTRFHRSCIWRKRNAGLPS
jgi:hypothetical protein